LQTAISGAHDGGIPVIYANDNRGVWDGDRDRLVREAREGLGPDVVEAVAPREGDRFVVKPRYSAFDLTPLELLLRELGAERVVLLGSTTEMCVAQTAIDARERDLKVTVVADACICIDVAMERIALAYLERVAGVQVARSPFF